MAISPRWLLPVCASPTPTGVVVGAGVGVEVGVCVTVGVRVLVGVAEAVGVAIGVQSGRGWVAMGTSVAVGCVVQPPKDEHVGASAPMPNWFRSSSVKSRDRCAQA